MKRDIYNIFFEQGLAQESLDFIECSKMKVYNSMDFGMRIQSVMQIPFYAKQVINHTEEIGICERVLLERSFTEESAILRNIQMKRISTRRFCDYISLKDLSNILLNSYFITETFESHSHHLCRRSIPSGGALYPIDLFYISINTKGLKTGVYYYNLHKESLECLFLESKASEFANKLKKMFPEEILGDWDLTEVSGIVVFCGKLNRVSCKYGDRGLRFALMDVGAILQNIHLAAATEDVACCAIGGYLDDELDKFLELRYPDETSLLSLFIGKNGNPQNNS
ncbi:nitroreductase [Bacteroidales bacterium]|nr:nitroreductase [Bacteroidales bacterium]